MSEVFSKVVSLIIACMLLIFAPIMYITTAQDTITQTMVLTKTTYFIDAIRNQGYVTPSMYEEYVKSIDATGNVYEIELTHYKKLCIPVYTDAADESTFQDTYSIDYEKVFMKDIMAVLYPTTDLLETERFYTCSSGDYLHITVVNQSVTIGTKLQRIMTGLNVPVTKILVEYGGMIRNVNSF